MNSHDKTLVCIGAKPSIASCVPTEIDILGTLMRCCEAWKPIEKLLRYIVPLSVLISRNFAKIIANIPWDADRKRHCCSQMQRWNNVLGVTGKLVLSLSAVTDEEGHPLENEDESGRRLCEYWRNHFSKHARKARDITSTEIFLRYVQQVS